MELNRALNATTHGITAKTLILQNEDPSQFQDLMQQYLDQFRPANQIQIDLVSDMVSARWRLRRIWRYQTAMLDIEMDAMAPEFERRYLTHDEDMRGSLAFQSLSDKGKGFNTAHRYEVHLGRQYRRALAVLQKLQNENAANETKSTRS